MKGYKIMKKTKSIICAVMALALVITALCGCGSSSEVKGIGKASSNKQNQKISTGDGASPSGQTAVDVSDAKYVAIDVKNYGTITVALYPHLAPITVENFLNLVDESFYDGLTFHRIMDGFMIQGGDPKGNGSGGSEKDIKGEFSANGVENNLSHKRGVISMARSNNPDSASSQFFIVQKDSTFLDGNYAGFGEVTSGMEVVDAIVKDAKPTDDNGTIKKSEQPVINSIKIVE